MELSERARSFDLLEGYLLEKVIRELNCEESRDRCNDWTLEAYVKDRNTEEDFIHLRVDDRVNYRNKIRKLRKVIREIKDAIETLRKL